MSCSGHKAPDYRRGFLHLGATRVLLAGAGKGKTRRRKAPSGAWPQALAIASSHLGISA